VAAAAAAGFGAITVRPDMYFAARRAGHSAADLRALLRDAAVRVSVVDPLLSALPGVPAPDAVPADLRTFFSHGIDDCLEAATALGAAAIGLAHFLGRRTPQADLVRAITAIAARARYAGLGVTIEFIPDTGIATLQETLELVRDVGASNVGVMFDTWHFARSGGQVAELRVLPPGAIAGLQINDRIAPPAAQGYVPMADRLLPGEGELPLVEVLGTLLPANPGLPVGVEVFSERLCALAPEAAAWRVAEATRAVLARVAATSARAG
jgi:sugar phosphate isomerase/epimerase